MTYEIEREGERSRPLKCFVYFIVHVAELHSRPSNVICWPGPGLRETKMKLIHISCTAVFASKNSVQSIWRPLVHSIPDQMRHIESTFWPIVFHFSLFSKKKKMNYFQQRVQPKKCHPSTTWIQLSSFDGQSTVLNGSSWDFFFFSLFVSILIFTALFFFLLVFIICSRRKCYITHEFGRWKKRPDCVVSIYPSSDGWALSWEK